MAKFASRCGNSLRFRLRFKKSLAIAVAMPWCTQVGCGSDSGRMWFGRGSDAVRTWFGCGSDVVRTWFGCGSDVVRTWFGRVFGSGADSLAEVKGKWFPAIPCLNPPFLGPATPEILRVRAVFSLQNVGKTQTQRILRGAKGGRKTSLC